MHSPYFPKSGGMSNLLEGIRLVDKGIVNGENFPSAFHSIKPEDIATDDLYHVYSDQVSTLFDLEQKISACVGMDITDALLSNLKVSGMDTAEFSLQYHMLLCYKLSKNTPQNIPRYTKEAKLQSKVSFFQRYGDRFVQSVTRGFASLFVWTQVRLNSMTSIEIAKKLNIKAKNLVGLNCAFEALKAFMFDVNDTEFSHSVFGVKGYATFNQGDDIGEYVEKLFEYEKTTTVFHREYAEFSPLYQLPIPQHIYDNRSVHANAAMIVRRIESVVNFSRDNELLALRDRLQIIVTNLATQFRGIVRAIFNADIDANEVDFESEDLITAAERDEVLKYMHFVFAPQTIPGAHCRGMVFTNFWNINIESNIHSWWDWIDVRFTDVHKIQICGNISGHVSAYFLRCDKVEIFGKKDGHGDLKFTDCGDVYLQQMTLAATDTYFIHCQNATVGYHEFGRISYTADCNLDINSVCWFGDGWLTTLHIYG